MRGTLVLIIVGVGLLALIRNRFAGLLLYTWYSFFRPQEWAYGSIAQYRPSLIIGVSLLGSCVLGGVVPTLTDPFSIGSSLFLLWTAVTAPWAVNPDAAWRAVGILAPTVIVALVAIPLTTTRTRFSLFVGAAAGSLAVHGAWEAFAQLVLGTMHIEGGIGGTFEDNNAFALGLVRVLFFLIAFSQNAPRRTLALASRASVPLTVLAIIFTFSRGAFLSLAAGSLVFLVLQRRKITSLLVVTAAALVLYAMLPPGYTNRVGTITTYQEQGDTSAIARLHFWRVAMEMVWDRPGGVGLGNFEEAYDHYDFLKGFGSRRAVHNTHFQALSETGWFGFALFEMLVVATLYVAARIRWRSAHTLSLQADQRFFETYSNAIMASTVAFIVGGSFLGQLLSELNWFTFAWTASLYRLQMVSLAQERNPAAQPVWSTVVGAGTVYPRRAAANGRTSKPSSTASPSRGPR